MIAATLLKRDDTTERQSLVIRRIAVSTHRMARTIANFLAVTRDRLGGGVPIEPESVDLRAISQQEIDQLVIAHPTRSVQLEAQENLRGEWDPDRIAQLVSNLVDNAIDYSPPDTPARVILRSEGADVILMVNNQGPTIPPEVMAQLFDPFRQGSQDGRVVQGRGLGLGLFIAKQIAEAHGGFIDVASMPNEGTTFTVPLPRSTRWAEPPLATGTMAAGAPRPTDVERRASKACRSAVARSRRPAFRAATRPTTRTS